MEMTIDTLTEWARIAYAAHREFNYVALGKTIMTWEQMDENDREFFVNLASRITTGRMMETPISQKVFTATIKALANL